ncbi:hypothetical protein Tco_0304792 [Tanacetum coccineum]
MPHDMLTPPTDESVTTYTQLSGVQGLDTQDHVLPTIQLQFTIINLSFISVEPTANQVIVDVIRQLSFDETELDGEADFGDVAGSGIESSGLSHDESFGVYDLDLNVNLTLNLNVLQTETQEEVHVSEGNAEEDVVHFSGGEDVEHGNGRNYEVTCEDKVKRHNYGTKTKKFKENHYLLPYAISNKEDTAYQRQLIIRICVMIPYSDPAYHYFPYAVCPVVSVKDCSYLGLRMKNRLSLKNDMPPRDKVMANFNDTKNGNGEHTNSPMITNSKLEIDDEFLKILQDNAFNGMDGGDITDHITKEAKDIYEVIDREYSPIPIPAHRDIDNPDELCRTEEFTVVRHSIGNDEEFVTVSTMSSLTEKITNGSWTEDGYCNRGSLPGAYIVGKSLHYQDLEWYEALEDSELKDEALRNKAIMEGSISDEESSNDGWRRWESHEITYHDHDEIENETHDERQELCEAHKLLVCNIKRFKMIKYSFRQDEEYVAVKEDEYDDLARTSNDACRAYQEIFRMMDEGWMVTRAE